jgi:hypothetical protein
VLSKPTNGVACPSPLLIGSLEATIGNLCAVGHVDDLRADLLVGTTIAMPSTCSPVSVLIALIALLESVPRSTTSFSRCPAWRPPAWAVGLVDEVLLIALLLPVGERDGFGLPGPAG